MSITRSIITLISLAAIAACESISPVTADPRSTRWLGVQTVELSQGAQPRVTGSGHLLRDLGSGEELTTFSYSAISHGDGSASGQYQYNFRAADFFIHGSVSCVTVAGNQGWIGGVIDKVVSADPADQGLVGTEIWWRVIDNGDGANDAPDQTSSLLFALPGLPITAASWCRDQNVRGVMRDVLSGNIQVR